MRLRRRVSRPELKGVGRSARPSLRLYDLELDPAALQEEGEPVGPAASSMGMSSGLPDGGGVGGRRAVGASWAVKGLAHIRQRP